MKTIKLYLLSGFLGAGKTTFLKKMLEAKPGLNAGIIMNEFGKISIDGPILENPNIEMVELTRGSIFCSCLKLSFAEALIQMADNPLDYVFVESSGLADPSNIGEILESVGNFTTTSYEYCGCINIVDAYHFMGQINEIETVSRQVETADMIIVNKVDRVDDNTNHQICEQLKSLNPSAEILTSAYYNIDFDFVGKKLIQADAIRNEASHNTPENKPKTFSMAFESSALSREDFTHFLDAISKDAYRIKGFVELKEGNYQFDVVGSLIDYSESENKFEKSTVVFISKIGPQLIKNVSDAWQHQLPNIPMKLAN